MRDFNIIDMLTALLVGIVLGMLIGMIGAGMGYKDFVKFCPECGLCYKAEEEYCSADGSELKMIGEANDR